MLLPGLLLVGAGLLLLLLTHYKEKKLPEGIRRSRGLILSAIEGADQQEVKGQYYAGKETITFSIGLPGTNKYFPGQQIFVDYSTEQPDQPIQLLTIQEVWGRKFLQLMIAVLLIVAGVVLVRIG